MNGSALKDFRRARQWRQRDLAAHLGVDQPAISEMERGMRQIPDEIAAVIAAESPASSTGDGVAPADAGELTSDDATTPAPPEAGAAPPSGDVPPRPTPPPRPRPAVMPSDSDMRALEVRVFKLIAGDEVEIMVADPGETEIRRVQQHLPGLADVIGMVNEFDGEIIRANAPAMSKAWVKVARENRRVRMVLETLTAGGAWRDAAAVTLPVVLAILLNHGLMPSLPGLMVAPGEGTDYTEPRGDDGAGDQSTWRETAAGTVG